MFGKNKSTVIDNKLDNIDRAAAIKAYRRQLGITVLSCVISLAGIAGASMAWFANNREIQSSGMQTQVEVSSNLVISDSAAGVAKLLTAEDTHASDPFSVSFSSSANVLKPAQHNEAVGSAVNLAYVTNTTQVSPYTGEKKGDTALTFAKVETTDYYVDYTVYIAAAGKAISAKSLTAEMKLTPTDSLTDYMNAASIDFYVDDTYKGTLNAVGKQWNSYTTDKTSVELAGSGLSIPLNTSGNYIKVKMRCYFDGGLKKNATTDYVRSAGLETGDFAISVKFTAVDTAAD